METLSSKEAKHGVKTIINEYCLKKGSFNPNKSSPNIFMRKLESRLKQYYNLLSVRNSRKKKINYIFFFC